MGGSSRASKFRDLYIQSISTYDTPFHPRETVCYNRMVSKLNDDILILESFLLVVSPYFTSHHGTLSGNLTSQIEITRRRSSDIYSCANGDNNDWPRAQSPPNPKDPLPTPLHRCPISSHQQPILCSGNGFSINRQASSVTRPRPALRSDCCDASKLAQHPHIQPCLGNKRSENTVSGEIKSCNWNHVLYPWQ